LTKREAEADERAEGADVEQGDEPRVAVPHHLDHRAAVGALVGQVVHEQRGADGSDGDEYQVHRAHQMGRPVTGGGDDQQADQLDHRDADVAAPGVEAQCPALVALRVERVDVRHRRCEVAAAQTSEGRDHHESGVRRVRLVHVVEGQQRRNQQDQGAEDGPVATPEGGGGERVGQPQERADQGRYGDQEELARRVDVVDVLRHEQHHDRPNRPDREADVFGDHRPDQVSSGDLGSAVVPGVDVLGVPVVDVVLTG
jgi:hypothetical protein